TAVLSSQDSIIETEIADMDSNEMEEKVDAQMLSEDKLITEEEIDSNDEGISEMPKPEFSAGKDAQRDQSVDKSKTPPAKNTEPAESIFNANEVPGEPEITVASSGKQGDTFLLIPIISSDTSDLQDSINVRVIYM